MKTNFLLSLLLAFSFSLAEADTTNSAPSTPTPEEIKAFEASCEKDKFQGCFDLATIYENGDGVEKDVNKAINLYKIACDYFSACFNLGNL